MRVRDLVEQLLEVDQEAIILDRDSNVLSPPFPNYQVKYTASHSGVMIVHA